MEKTASRRLENIGGRNISKRNAMRAGAALLSLGLGAGALLTGTAAGESDAEARAEQSKATFYFNKHHYSGFVLPKYFEKQDEQVKITATTTTTVPVFQQRTGVDWDGIAQCETGSNWSMQGSTYSGGVGFYNGTWNGFGGQEFAPNAGQATKEEQIIVAERVHDEFGLSGWGCKAYG